MKKLYYNLIFAVIFIVLIYIGARNVITNQISFYLNDNIDSYVLAFGLGGLLIQFNSLIKNINKKND